MHVSDFYGCCGVRTLARFGCYGEGDVASYLYRREVKNFLKDQIVDWAPKVGIAMLVATLNEWQNRQLGRVFVSAGFRHVGQGSHAHATIHLYIYEHEPTPRKE